MSSSEMGLLIFQEKCWEKRKVNKMKTETTNKKTETTNKKAERTNNYLVAAFVTIRVKKKLEALAKRRGINVSQFLRKQFIKMVGN